MSNGHGICKCKYCDMIIWQCRCMDHTNVIYDVCGKCKLNMVDKLENTLKQKYDYGCEIQFNVGLAQKYGLHEAIFIDILAYWLMDIESEDVVIIINEIYIKTTINTIKSLLSFLNDSQVNKVLNNLKTNNIIEIFNKNNHVYIKIIDKEIIKLYKDK